MDEANKMSLMVGASRSEMLEYETRSKLKQYLDLPRDEDLRTGMQTVFMNLERPSGSDREKTLLVVTGDSGSGKSTAIERLCRSHPALPHFGTPQCPLISILMSSPATLKIFGRALLQAMGYPLQSDLREGMTWDLVYTRAAMLNVRAFHVDEFQHVNRSGSDKEKENLRNTVKTLLLKKMGLIISGMPDLLPILEQDEQVRRRAIFVRFGPLSPIADLDLVEGVIDGSSKSVGLSVDAGILNDMAARALHAGNGQVGQMVGLVHGAATTAVVSGDDVLRMEHFAKAYASATSNSVTSNPFVVEDWRSLDCRRVLDHQSKETLAEQPPANAPKKRRNRAPKSVPDRRGF